MRELIYWYPELLWHNKVKLRNVIQNLFLDSLKYFHSLKSGGEIGLLSYIFPT